MRVRLAINSDVAAMVELDRQNPTSAHWSRLQYEALFASDSQSGSERVAWVIEAQTGPDGDDISVAQIYAFLVARKIDAEWELENIVVADNSRRRGFGSLLMRELLAHTARRRGSIIFLEVRESNLSARSLYRKIGFQETGLRKGYYGDPAEDAILYRLSLS